MPLCSSSWSIPSSLACVSSSSSSLITVILSAVVWRMIEHRRESRASGDLARGACCLAVRSIVGHLPLTRRESVARFAWLAVLACAASTVGAQQTTPPTDSALAAITARGRALAAYDYAAWHGTDAVIALHPPRGTIRGYIARRTDVGWMVAFGYPSAQRD